ncbi:MAG: hypothetical protein JWM38_2027 [Sphingomonas bacterium]|nr:hypothetical protein [Sphingomonas bacterium]
MSDARRHAPATLRNREAILDVLRAALPARGLVLELASGSGEHIAHFARNLPRLDWQPSDPDAAARGSIAAWAEGVANVRPPIAIDAAAADWPIAAADAMLCINMVHISPWAATEGLVAGASRLLSAGGLLYLYGPFSREGRHSAASNAAFDADLRARDPAWGVRDLEAVAALADAHKLGLERVIEMPANNLSVLLRRR